MQTPAALRKINYLFLFLLLMCFNLTINPLKAQSSYHVLFLGNSYTGVNNLPQLVHDVALSAGDTLIFDSYTPGGYQLVTHQADPVSHAKISTGGWDYVVIQGQSQEPVIQYSQFISGGSALHSLVKQYNPCAVVMPYITWGRKNGDAANCPNFPEMCTYEGMDSTLRKHYLNLANFINGEVSPVSVVWHYLRQNYPAIELYQADESHPSLAGSYAAACCFYAALFKKDPSLITFNSTLNATDAAVIKNAAKILVFDSLPQWDFKKMPEAGIRYLTGPGTNEIIFNNASQGVKQNYAWDFGDGASDSTANPIHSYSANGAYTVTLTTSNCDLQGLHTAYDDTVIQFCNHTPTVYTSQPWLCNYDTLWTQTADSYQWFANGVALPETSQYVANYAQYYTWGFSVISTLNGCSELSTAFMGSPVWPGYYFDALGDPCIGDTVAFAVLHINGFLSGTENIFWFKNDTLLPLLTNADTLLITEEGKYECKIVNPVSDCPFDTTAYAITYNCGTTGVDLINRELTWKLFPNPATETITVAFMKSPLHETVEIYNATGRLTKSMLITGSSTQIKINSLPAGVYYVKLKNNKLPALKFIKLP